MTLNWADTLPANWQVRKLKYIAYIRLSNADKKSIEGEQAIRLCNYVDVYKNDFIVSTMSFMEATATDSQIRELVIRAGDVLITKDSEEWSDIAVPAYVPVDLPGVICGYHLSHIRPYADQVFGGYLFRAFAADGIADQFKVAANGITRYGISKDDISSALFPVPPIPEQRNIAAFLDHKTAEIDAVIAKKERLIALLQEERQALISHGVLSQYNRRKARLAYYVSLLPGYAFPSTDFSHDPEDIRLLRGINVTPQGISWDEVVYWKRTGVSSYSDFALQQGDLVFGMDRPKISSGIRVARISEIDLPAFLLQRVARLRAAEGLEQDYLEILLRSDAFWGHLEPDMTGVSVPHVSPDQILSFEFWLPPVADQKAVCRDLAKQMLRIDRLTNKNTQQITKLREYRQALISAAVTGKIPVSREVAT